MISPAVFIQEVRVELNRVSWPSRQKVTRLTIVVITVSVFVAMLVGGLDFVFTKLMEVGLKLKNG
jgi:preprotein translocase subunit SecE